MTTVTLELPRRIYQKAAQIAKKTKRPIEQVVVEWIQPPTERGDSLQDAVLADLAGMNRAQLAQVARSAVAADDTNRLRELLSLQQQRQLTEAEHKGATHLVEQEDLMTLRKAKALYLLKQRNSSPDDLMPSRS